MGTSHSRWFVASLSLAGIVAGCGGDSFDVSRGGPDAAAGAGGASGSGGTGTGGSGLGGAAGSAATGGTAGSAGTGGNAGASGIAGSAGEGPSPCEMGYADCDKNDGNGCEVDLLSSAENCGSCGHTCSSDNATPECVEGVCVLTCDTGFGDCDGLETNGCEQDLLFDVLNCGTCDKACPLPASGQAACSGGVCGISCDSGKADCDGDETNGCETNTLTNVAHCGGCTLACSTNHGIPGCSAGTCSIQCDSGWGDCDGNVDDGCETNTNIDVLHCGGCSIACSDVHGTPNCAAGACNTLCESGWGDCDGSVFTGCETNTNIDVDHCGNCGEVCPTPPNSVRGCSSGMCTMTCNEGFANCNNNESDGCEINLNNTATHCGACGHDCLGGDCEYGMCQPITISDAQAKPRGIAVTSTRIYWTNQGTTGASGTVKWVDKTGGAMGQLASGQADPRGIAVGSDFVLWANHGISGTPGAIMKFLFNVAPALQTFSANQADAAAIVLNSASAYWTRDSASGFVQAQKHGAESPEFIATGQNTPQGIAVDSSSYDAYWTVANGIRRGKPKQSVEIVANTSEVPAFLALDTTHVYWTSSGSVFRAPKQTFATVQNLSGTAGVGGQGIVVYGGFVYWCAQQAIWKMPVAGGPAVKLASGVPSPWGIAADEQFVYWTENVANGSVRKVVRL